MLRLIKIIKDYVPNIKTLNTLDKQAKCIQELYEQVKEFYNYLSNPEFKGLIKGDKGDDGKSSFDLWKQLPGNEHKDLNDYFSEIVTDPLALHGSVKVVNITENTDVLEVTTNNSQINVIYTNNTQSTKTIHCRVSTTTKSSDGSDIILSIPSNGYVEINYLNIDGITYIRGC